MKRQFTRRGFLSTTAAAPVVLQAAEERPAILGGKPVRTGRFPSWPVAERKEEEALAEVARGRKWFRGSGKQVAAFEEAWAKMTGAKYCLATSSGTAALFTSLNALGIGPGDEVLVPPFTFVATINVVLLQYALPVFVDTDPETCQMDAGTIEAAVRPRTAAIIPVHYGGNPANLDEILAIARKRNLRVIEDACQAHLAAWRGRNVGNYGETGCFSFQESKNLNCGDGGAIITNDEALMSRCYAFHNQGRRWKGGGDQEFSYGSAGCNLRLTEFQAAVLLSQMTRLEEQSRTREQNAEYLDSLLREIPGVRPQRRYAGCTRHNHHTYVFRFDKEQFAGMPKPMLLKALNAEGIPGRAGYSPLNTVPFIKKALEGRAYRSLFSKERLAEWNERNHCPGNERLCRESVVFSHQCLLGPRTDMEQIAAGVRKVQAHAAEMARA
ncbi:MAG: DegT/DnrJ/EryC1/StrS family aminotransferase [Acidobacteria bacterium]|nr:DegT/DnrJ/EryC1/StrS family aminotransferase [Acidobacteriota bacterium]